MQKEFQRKETIPNYKWCLCMIRFPTTASQVALAIQMGGGGGGGVLFSVVYSAFESIWDSIYV